MQYFQHKKEWNSDTCYNMDLEDFRLGEISQTQKTDVAS